MLDSLRGSAPSANTDAWAEQQHARLRSNGYVVIVTTVVGPVAAVAPDVPCGLQHSEVHTETRGKNLNGLLGHPIETTDVAIAVHDRHAIWCETPRPGR